MSESGNFTLNDLIFDTSSSLSCSVLVSVFCASDFFFALVLGKTSFLSVDFCLLILVGVIFFDVLPPPIILGVSEISFSFFFALLLLVLLYLVELLQHHHHFLN